MFKKLDWQLNGAIIFLAIASLLILASSSPHLFWKQALWYLFGFTAVFGFANIDWRWLSGQLWLRQSIYWLVLGLLFITYFMAPPIRGVRSWLVLGPFQFQFSELAKLSLIIVYAGFFAARYFESALLRNIIYSFLYLLPNLLMVLVQPDLGTAVILFGIWAGFVLLSGITWRQFFAGVLIMAVLGVFAWTSFLKSYQKERIVSFLFPDIDPLGVSYNVIQSKIAIGSAGFFGKGFGQGTQVQLGFLPEAQADFIFAAFTEEWGLLGGFLIIAAFWLILYRIARIGLHTGGNYAKFAALGTLLVLILHFVFNIGSNLGLLPVVGVTFPFFSYGGSSLLTLFILIGIIQSINKQSSF
ncbi:MAG: rod shape-determining protein RodA [Candidatus Brennerbacteria bacterium]|nr:rod shape-determining protein RodA [Candidatus Brennerbacteria bacterium]